MFERVNHFSTEAWRFVFVPTSSLLQFPRSILADMNLCHLGYEIRSLTPAITSEASSKVARPSSISLMRRTISRSHALDPSGSAGPSKLATRSCASRARSASLSANRSFRKTERSRVAMGSLGGSMGLPKYHPGRWHITSRDKGVGDKCESLIFPFVTDPFLLFIVA